MVDMLENISNICTEAVALRMQIKGISDATKGLLGPVLSWWMLNLPWHE